MKLSKLSPSSAPRKLPAISWPWVSGTIVFAALVAFGLAWASSLCIGCEAQGASATLTLNLWLSFLAITLTGALILWIGWRLMLASERPSGAPNWLATLLIGAALLRLAAGVLWAVALPSTGHGTQQEINGYVMADAYERDQLAWKIAQAPRTISESYELSRRSDPYGGLLFISAMIYRIFGAQQHAPLSLVVISAAVSALAILFGWAFARRNWGERVGQLTAWGLALYPETVLLGSSQMREAFLIPLIAAAFYGLARLRRERSWIGLTWLLSGILLTLFFSPPIIIMLLVSLVLAAFTIRDDLFHRHVAIPRWAWLALAGVIGLALLGGWLAIRQFAPPEISNPLDVASYWLRKSVDLQAYFSKSASGWIQKIFRSTPEWSHLPILIGYGVLRPFLPAALVVTSSAQIWPWITLWRAAGWAALFGLIAYGALRAWFKKDADAFTKGLAVIVWLGILIASLRGGGDQDDNPRYRAIFAGLQIGLAAWAWVEQRRSADPLFRQALVTLAFIIGWSLLWYLRRLYSISWAVADPFKIIGLGLACGILYSLWDWARAARPRP